ncbi:MAG TPA: class I SAM-dependent methyltransferase [Pyrinomonadaceae bacterium]
MSQALPREMQPHTYAIMREVEDTHWWYVGRRRIIADFVRRICDQLRAEGNSEPRILDIGCGTGGNLETLSGFGRAEGVDISSEALDFCRARGLNNVRQGAAETLPYESESFDLVTGLDVVEHLDDDVSGLREMRRVLRPGGRMLLFVPAFMFLWGVQDDVSHHRRRYTVSELQHKLQQAGMSVERASYANISFFGPILLGRLFMRVTGLRPASENNINVSAFNGVFGKILGAESWWLNRLSFPFGVSIICVARRT